jgi:hypothetical protein
MYYDSSKRKVFLLRASFEKKCLQLLMVEKQLSNLPTIQGNVS